MQVFRLMGMPDKMIAFDDLPKEYTEGLELCDCSKLGRAWRDFIGPVEKKTEVKPDRDPFTGQMRTYPALVQTAPYAYLIDKEINNDVERWKEIESYVKKNAPDRWTQKGIDGNEIVFRLTDKLEDMARPLAKDIHSEVTLEPEEIVLIPLKKETAAVDMKPAYVPNDAPKIVAPAVEQATAEQATPEKKKPFPCKLCDRSYSNPQVLYQHVRVKHREAMAKNRKEKANA